MIPYTRYRWVVLLLTSLPLWWNAASLHAQEDKVPIETVTTEKKRLLILPTGAVEDDSYTIDQEVTGAIAGLAVQLGRFEIIDRNNLVRILNEQDLYLLGLVDDSAAISLGEIAAAKEALLITVLDFTQRGVPPPKDDDDDEDESLRAAIVKGLFVGLIAIIGKKDEEEKDPYPHNIQTQLSVEVRNLDVETGETLYSFYVDASHTGGTAGRSRAKAMASLRRQVKAELRAFYLLSSRVLAVQGNELILLLGEEMGLRRGMLFEIQEPDREETFDDRTVTIPGRPAGYAAVKDLSPESSRAVVVRQWSPINTGYQAMERIRPLTAGLIEASPSLQASCFTMGLGGQYRGAGRWDISAGLLYSRIIDSRQDVDHGIAVDVSIGLRLALGTRLSVLNGMGIMMTIPFRQDDSGHTVATALLAPAISARMEWLLSPELDLVVGVGYRFAGRSSDWKYAEANDENSGSRSAVWDGPAPEVDITGLYVTAGIKFIMPGR